MDINIEFNEDGLFPLALAVLYGYKIMTQLIAKNKYSMLDQTDKKGQNILHFAAKFDRLEILDLFIKDPKLFIEYKADNKNNFPL